MTNQMIASLAYIIVPAFLWGIVYAPKEWFSPTGKLFPAIMLYLLSSVIIGICFQDEEIIFVLIASGIIGLIALTFVTEGKAYESMEIPVGLLSVIASLAWVLLMSATWIDTSEGATEQPTIVGQTTESD